MPAMGVYKHNNNVEPENFSREYLLISLLVLVGKIFNLHVHYTYMTMYLYEFFCLALMITDKTYVTEGLGACKP